MTEFSSTFGLNPNDIRHDTFRRAAGELPLLRLIHLPSGIEISRERPTDVSVYEFKRQLIFDLSELVFIKDRRRDD